MEQIIINSANEIVKGDFIQYPDQEKITDLKSALTVILSENLKDFAPSEIYQFLNSKF